MSTPTVVTGPGRVLDAYSIKARWSPVLLVVLPLLLLCFSLIPGLPAWTKLWPLAGAAGVVILAYQLGRDGGKRLQSSLWATWGGAPTTAALRHREAANPVLLARQHERIAAITGKSLPTAQEERADPAGADHAYETAIAVLIARTCRTGRSAAAGEPLHTRLCMCVCPLRRARSKRGRSRAGETWRQCLLWSARGRRGRDHPLDLVAKATTWPSGSRL